MHISDCHCHFLSARFFEALGREKVHGAAQPTASDVAGELGVEPPGTT